MNKNLIDRRIVTIGGGTGGFTVNRGLHAYPVFPTAICTVFDSGGSSGIIRDEFGTLPQGDIRRCLLALASGEEETLRELFNYRFENGARPTSTLSDHSLGNLLLLAAEKLWGPVAGIRHIGKLLGIRGQVLPVSTDSADLCAELSDGTVICGESAIDLRSPEDPRTVVRVWLSAKAYICKEAADAIISADVIVLGPGDLFSSVIPNLLVEGVADAIAKSNAKLVYITNLMTKYSETRDYSLGDFLRTLHSYGIGREKFDAVLVNTTPIPHELLELYAKKDKSAPLVLDETIALQMRDFTKQLIADDFLSNSGLQQNLVRHGPAKLAKKIIELAGE